MLLIQAKMLVWEHSVISSCTLSVSSDSIVTLGTKSVSAIQDSQSVLVSSGFVLQSCAKDA